MKKSILIQLVFGLLFSTTIHAQSVKLDLNMEGRSATEVNETGYTSWFIGRVNNASITVSGVTFTVKATGPTALSTFRAGWSKTLVQSPYLMRLVNDGIKVDNDTLLKYPTLLSSMELTLKGLTPGEHTIQTYHNAWEDTTSLNHALLDVYLNGTLVHSKVKRSVLVRANSTATCLLTSFTVGSKDEEVVLRFAANNDFTAYNSKKIDLNICLNAIELDTDDASKQVADPSPEHRNFHADADSGYVDLKWKAAISNKSKTHTIYIGADSVAVTNAGVTDALICKGTVPVTTTTYRFNNPYHLNTYYWRVDETDSAGVTYKGKIWTFQTRHLAFKEAEGYGRFARGGRGGKVVYVTNLNDSGPGSFREAVTSTIGPRIVVFNVSGVIRLESRLVTLGNITIAGQTAPGKGICFRTSPMGISDDCVLRFIRMRLGGGPTYDGIGVAGDNMIIDHCSVSWTIDEAFSSRNGKNLTLQKTMIAEALNVAGHSNYPAGTAHGYAGTISGNVGSFHHNLLAHCEGRNFSMGNAIDGGGVYVSKLDLFNNVVYNFGKRANDGQVHFANFVNNYFKKGPATGINFTFKMDFENYGTGTLQAYCSGNILQNTDKSVACDGTDNTCGRLYTLQTGLTDPTYQVFVNQPLFPSYAKIHTAKEAYKMVLSDVGCNLPLFDDHDKRIINETLNGSYTYVGSYTGKKGLIDNEADTGGYEDYPATSRASDFDTDLDGLPDWWEKLHNTNPNSTIGDFTETNTDADGDGYTNMDDYLEWMSVPQIALNDKYTIDLKQYCTGFSGSMQFSTVSAPQLNVVYSGTNAILTPQPAASGVSYYIFRLTDSEGTVYERKLGVVLNANTTAVKNTKNSSGMYFYPTTVKNELNVVLNSEVKEDIFVEIVDLSAKVLFSKRYYNIESIKSINISGLRNIPSQLLIAKVRCAKSNEVIYSQRLVKD